MLHGLQQLLHSFLADGCFVLVQRRKSFPLVEGVPQFVGTDGLEQVVNAIYFERVEGVLVVGSGEDYRAVNGDMLKDAEGQAVGKVDVHKDDVGFGVNGKPVDGLLDALQCLTYFDVGCNFSEQTGEV